MTSIRWPSRSTASTRCSYPLVVAAKPPGNNPSILDNAGLPKTHAVLIIVGAFGWWVWPHEVALTYTNAPEFNLYRRSRIQVAADSYSRFLKGVGFSVPMAAPVLGVSSGRVQAGLLPGLDTFRMTIAREDLDHPDDDLMAAYGFYIFSRAIHEPSAENFGTFEN